MIITVGVDAEALAASEAADLVVFAVRVLVAHSPADHAAVVWPLMGGASGAGLWGHRERVISDRDAPGSG